MKTTLISNADATTTLSQLIHSCTWIDFAVAWAGNCSITEDMLDDRNGHKLRRIVIGTHLYQTDPAVLSRFLNVPSGKYMPPDGQLFHPKTYLFTFSKAVVAVVGSHNLTNGAFGDKNIEASILIKGKSHDHVIRAIGDFVTTSWNNARARDDEFLADYKDEWNAKKKTLKELKRFSGSKKTRSVTSPLDWPWRDFYRYVKEKDQHKSIDKRLKVLSTARAFFERSGGSLRNMPLEARKAIAGTYHHAEDKPNDLPWGWFGGMFGQGSFKALVNKNSTKLSKALDHIKMKGDVTEAQYRKFRRDFSAAFKDEVREGGIATATRLLAMKRPDVFVAVNKGNRKNLCNALNIAETTLSLDNYWNRIIAPVQLSPWWNQRRPTEGKETKIWDNRAALLDCIYYESS